MGRGRDRLTLRNAYPPACPFRPPSHLKTLLLGGYLPGKHTDDLKDVDPDLDVTTEFLFSFIRHLLCVRHSARCFAQHTIFHAVLHGVTPVCGYGLKLRKAKEIARGHYKEWCTVRHIILETMISLAHQIFSLNSVYNST